MKKSKLEAQAMVTLDAIEAEDPRAPKLLAPIIKAVTAHGIREGREDYQARASDVAAGLQDEDWAWPFETADDAYLNAVGSSGIMDEIGLPDRMWEHVGDAWLDAFKRGYVKAHEDAAAHARKQTRSSSGRLPSHASGRARQRLKIAAINYVNARHGVATDADLARVALRKSVAQLDREIADALGERPEPKRRGTRNS